MRIGMVLDKEFAPDVRVENEARLLVKNGYKVFLLCLSFDKKLPAQEEYKGFWIIRCHRKKSWYKIWNLTKGYPWSPYERFWRKATAKFVHDFQIEALHVHDLYMMGAGEYVKKRFKIPIVVDLHENYLAALKAYKWTQPWLFHLVVNFNRWQNLEKRYLKSAQRIIVLSDYYREKLSTQYPGVVDKIYVYPNVPDVTELLSYAIDSNVAVAKDRFILFYFGVIAERRGIYVCLEAVKLLIPKIPNILLLVAGRIDKQDRKPFQETIAKFGIDKHVQHIPWIDISLLPSYCRQVDVCLSPLIKNEQHESGVANKIFQYMLFAKPLVVSDCRPQQEIIYSTKCGLVFRSGDAADLAAQIAILYNDHQLRKTMGENGRKAVLETYNTEKQGRQLVKLYYSLAMELQTLSQPA